MVGISYTCIGIHTVTKLIVSLISLKTMAGGHAVQGILSTVVVLYKHFVWNEKELTSPERCSNNHVILQQVGQCLLIS